MLSRALLLVVLATLVIVPLALHSGSRAVSATADTVVVISPHNEAIRYEFERGFARWYRTRTRRRVRVDWRVVGGTADISRYLDGAYAAAFERQWTSSGHAWNEAIQTRFQLPHAADGARPDVRTAREAFLASEVSSGIDVFFGGDAYQYGKEAEAGRLVDAGLTRLHPDWFRDDTIPRIYGGETFWDAAGRWYGVVLSGYGIVANRDALARLGVARPPEQWTDLGDPTYLGQLALADPTKSGSVCEAFENILQQQMQRAVRETDEARGVAAGWLAGLRVIQAMGANARYFTDSSQKPPIDVAAGDCAVGLCIDFYGRQQEEAIARRSDRQRLVFTTPKAGTAISADPIGLLRGAPHRETAIAFLEFVLSLEGQKLWALHPGTPDGPEQYALRRAPIRRDFYGHEEWRAQRSDPDDAPYADANAFTYHAAWTGGLFREIGFVTRVMCQDSHRELVRAWRAVQSAPEPRRSRALSVLRTIDAVTYDRVAGEIHRRLNATDRVEEVRLATELGAYFRANYARAEAIARGTDAND